METFWIILLLIIFIITFVKFLQGDYTIAKTEVLREGNLREGKLNVGYYYVIKITYKSGRIKIKTFET